MARKKLPRIGQINHDQMKKKFVKSKIKKKKRKLLKYEKHVEIFCVYKLTI